MILRADPNLSARGGIGRDLAIAAVVIASVAAFVFWPRGRGPREPPSERARPAVVKKAPAPPPKKPTPRPPKKPEKKAKAKEELSPRERNQMLAAVWHVMYQAERQLRKEPSEEVFARLKEAIGKARKLIAAAPGSIEARRVQLCLFRCLAMAGERELAEVEFQIHLEAVAAVEGTAAACKLLLEEGRRESRRQNYPVALKRFRTVLAYVKEGETAARAHQGIGGCYGATRQRLEADAAFRRAIELGLPTPDASRVYRRLISVAISRRESDQARRDTAALLALPIPDAQRANDEARLGIIIERTEGLAKAIQHYQQVIQRYPNEQCAFARARLWSIQRRVERGLLDPLPGEPGGAKK